MQLISQLVYEHIVEDITALNYLKNGLLNTAQYAELIKPEIEYKLYTTVSKSSIVTALSRIKKNLNQQPSKIPKFEIEDIKLNLPISELVYKKDKNPSLDLIRVYQEIGSNNQTFLNINNATNEIDIFVSSSKKEAVKKLLKEQSLAHEVENLAVITLKYDPRFRDYPGIAAQVLNLLSIKNINMVEALTTYSEFTIYIQQDNAQKAIQTLQESFMKQVRT